MLTDHFPLAEEKWEDLIKEENYWSAWNKLYRADDRKSKVKKQEVGGQYQFCATHGALRQSPQAQQANSPTRSAADLGGYVDSLDAAATTEKGFMEELVKANVALTTNNAELLASADSLIKSNEQLSRWVGNRQNNKKTPTREDTPPFPNTLCPH